MNCIESEILPACFIPDDPSLATVDIVYVRNLDANGDTYREYFQEVGSTVKLDPATFMGGGIATVGECADASVECVESQEWTYAIDNTGTQTNFSAELEIGLSDGSSFIIQQTNQGVSQWTPQMQEWGDNIQTAADNAGLAWFVDTRYIVANPANLAGGGGFSGPASETVSSKLYASGMRWRYVNIQICPGQPVPVSAVFRGIDNTDPRYNEVQMVTTPKAILGPISKFFVCRSCAQEPVWYLEDGITPADAGQIPNCWEPCGTLSLVDSPPDSECTFEIDVACDSNNSTNTVDFINTITRRATVCNGEQIGVDYFQADPNDPGALVPYTLIGDFVDCATGEPVPEPEPLYFEVKEEKLCETDAEFLLLIDSGGVFARYSFYTETWETVPTLSVASAGGSADVENFLLYNFVAPDQMTVVDVNTDTQLPNVTLIDGVINPAVATNPKNFAAAAFRKADGRLYAQDTAGADAGLYSINVQTGAVDFVTTISGVAGTGTSIMIDNSTDTLIVNGSNLSYEVDFGTGVATVWGNPPIRPNGGTFDEDGNAYVTEGLNTYSLAAGLDPNDLTNWVQIIDDFGPGANSIAYYRVEAPSPSCFIRRFGVFEDGTSEIIGDFNIADNSPRTVVGDIDCCECSCGGGSGGGSPSDVLDVTPNPDQTHAIVHGQNTSVPAGLKSVTINSLTGVTTLDGAFEIGDDRRVVSISYDATEIDRARGLLPAIAVSGGTWQWTGIQPIAEV